MALEMQIKGLMIDPVSHIPEYKICAVRVLKVSRPTDAMAAVPQQAGGLG